MTEPDKGFDWVETVSDDDGDDYEEQLNQAMRQGYPEV